MGGLIAYAACGPCEKAHAEDNHSCSPDNCIGYYWEVAIPGDCKNTSGDECREDGVTNVVIKQKRCKEELIGKDCTHPYIIGAPKDTKEIADCYIVS